MADVVSFRPNREEAEAIERVRKAHGFKTRADAVRYLIREGARRASDWRDDPLFQFRIEGFVEPGEEITSREIDQALYGGS
jgi:hypothetical protein